MLERIRHLLSRWFAGTTSLLPPELPLSAEEAIASTDSPQEVGAVHSDVITPLSESHVPYDDSLFDRSRTQWQFGDWDSLAKLDREQIQHHPERGKLALLSAAGHLHLNNMSTARQFIRAAQEWGCTRKLITQILVAGVHNSLGRAASVAGQQARSVQHFETAISIVTPGSDVRLISKARSSEQISQLGLPEKAGEQWSAIGKVISKPAPISAHVETPAQTTEKLNAEMRIAVSNEMSRQTPNPYVHNRNLTPELNTQLRQFAATSLGQQDLKATYIDYLAAKAIQIEHNCVGRLATTVQDAVARQLVVQSLKGERACILEIGALYGVGLAILYNHAITRFKEVRVICLDPFEGYYGKAIDAVLNSPVNDLTFFRNMQLANVPEQDFQMIKQLSTDQIAIDAARELSFNLLVIDGDHSYEGVKFDFDNYFPMLEPGGYVIFDDYNAKEWPGVQEFIDKDLSAVDELEFLGAVSRTAIGRKKMDRQ